MLIKLMSLLREILEFKMAIELCLHFFFIFILHTRCVPLPHSIVMPKRVLMETSKVNENATAETVHCLTAPRDSTILSKGNISAISNCLGTNILYVQMHSNYLNEGVPG